MRNRVSLLLAFGAVCAALLAAAGTAAAADTPATTTAAAATTTGSAGTAVADPLAGMATAVAAAGTYRSRTIITMRSSSVAKALVIKADAETRATPMFMRMEYDMSSVMVAGGGKAADGRYTMLLASDGPSVVMFMRGGPFGKFIAKGRAWAKVDTSFITKASGIDLTKSLSAGNDPSAQLASLRKAGATYELVGKETFGGVSTTHWKVTAPLAKAMRAQGQSAAQVAKIMAVLPAGTDSLVYDLWLDGKQFPRRMLFTIPVVSGSDLIEEEMDMRFFSPGAIVRTTLPPDRLVEDITKKLLDSLNG